MRDGVLGGEVTPALKSSHREAAVVEPPGICRGLSKGKSLAKDVEQDTHTHTPTQTVLLISNVCSV